MTTPSKDYVLGTTDEELVRLGYQHQAWLGEAVDLWQRAKFGLGDKILDLGCGPGFATLDLARLVGPTGTILAVDASEKFISFLNGQIASNELNNIETHLSDVTTFSYPENSLDGIFARWLLGFLSEPEKLIAKLSRAMKRGGRFVIKDYFAYRTMAVFPESEAINKLFLAYDASIRKSGGNWDMAGILPEMLARNGFEISLIKPINRVSRPGERLWNWAEVFHKSYVPKIVEMNLLTQSEADAFWRDWNAAAKNPNAFFYTPPIFGIISVKL